MMHHSSPQRALAAYQKIGIGARVSGSSPQQLMLMLFDALSVQLQRAKTTLTAGDMGAKGVALTKAARLVEEGLRPGLNRSSGNDSVEVIDRLYQYWIVRLTEANLYKSHKHLDEVIELVKPLHDAWRQLNAPGRIN